MSRYVVSPGAGLLLTASSFLAYRIDGIAEIIVSLDVHQGREAQAASRHDLHVAPGKAEDDTPQHRARAGRSRVQYQQLVGTRPGRSDKLVQRDLKSIVLLHSFGEHAIFDGKRGTLLSDGEILDDQGKHFAFPAAQNERFILFFVTHRSLPLL
jgi:hypothetical protein